MNLVDLKTRLSQSGKKINGSPRENMFSCTLIQDFELKKMYLYITGTFNEYHLVALDINVSGKPPKRASDFENIGNNRTTAIQWFNITDSELSGLNEV